MFGQHCTVGCTTGLSSRVCGAGRGCGSARPFRFGSGAAGSFGTTMRVVQLGSDRNARPFAAASDGSASALAASAHTRHERWSLRGVALLVCAGADGAGFAHSVHAVELKGSLFGVVFWYFCAFGVGLVFAVCRTSARVVLAVLRAVARRTLRHRVSGTGPTGQPRFREVMDHPMGLGF